MHIYFRILRFRGRGIFATKYFLQKVIVLSGIHLYTWKYNVCSIKLETRLLCLHRIQVYNISLILVNRYAVHNFLLLRVNVLHTDYTYSAYSPITLTFSLICIITTCCITCHCKWILNYRFVQK